MKSHNELESFIEANRSAFDDERPSLKVWPEIERKLVDQKARKSNLGFSWWGAVAAVLLLLIGIALGILVYPQIQHQRALQAIHEHTELDDMEIFFYKEVQIKLAALEATPVEAEVKRTLRETDGEIRKLKLDLIYAPKSSREEIMQAIIASYETKIHILQTALERLSPININDNEATIL